ncbi:MAG TPA: DegT/DnrJ/EryC1/StrS family aminotransferase [Verrucomicrobiota bacterium]|nr:DegT/DnrJ/EryC1/StrS family aminotransferase [Verrucomicrobiota bacterium]
MKVDSHRKHLAIQGAPPAFSEPIHVGRPNVVNRERFLELVGGVLDRRWLTNNGPLVQEFERRLAEYAGVKHCIAVCNATIGLELAVRAAGLRGEVIVPSFTFIATAHALQWQEITPVFADIDPATHCLNPAVIERHITHRTTGIIATHLWGRSCDVEGLEEIARRRDLVLMFDAAHAFGCTHRGKRIGGFGLAEVFSFHATKFLSSFEGGAITTNDDQLAERIRLMKNFGFKGYDNVIHVGTNGKMTEVCAAMGLSNLEGIDQLIATNRHNYETYQASLSDIPGFRLFPYDPREELNYQYVVGLLDEAKAGLTQDELLQILRAENILARKYFWPGCHRMEPYRSNFPQSGLLLPETEHIAQRVIVLPTGTAVDSSAIKQLCDIIRFALANRVELRKLLLNRNELAPPSVTALPGSVRPQPPVGCVTELEIK